MSLREGSSMPTKSLLASVGVLATVLMVGTAPELPRVVKAWAALMQAMTLVEESVATKELSAIHREDTALATAIAVLQGEIVPAGRDGRPELASALAAFGPQVGELHEAADAGDIGEAHVQLQKLLAVYARIKTFYPETVLAPARRLAETYACPMHRDVVGRRG